MKNQIVTDTVKAIFDQTRLDESFRVDVTKAVAAVFDAATASAAPVLQSVPLTADEIALVRDSFKK